MPTKLTSQSKNKSRISDEVVKNRTGKTWDEWFKILDKAGAKEMSHKDIAQYLYNKKLIESGWWCQSVTVAYEQERGMRDKNQKPDGYEISVSKVIEVPIPKLYNAWENDKLRSKWLNEKIVIRKATENKSMRITWIDGKASLSIHFYSKGDNKSQLVVQHSKIKSKQEAEKLKIYWKDKIDKLINII